MGSCCGKSSSALAFDPGKRKESDGSADMKEEEVHNVVHIEISTRDTVREVDKENSDASVTNKKKKKKKHRAGVKHGKGKHTRMSKLSKQMPLQQVKMPLQQVNINVHDQLQRLC